MSVNSEAQPPSRSNTSWAGVVSKGSPPQQQPSGNDWPTIAQATTQTAELQPDAKQGQVETLVENLKIQLQKIQLELELEQANARNFASERDEAEAKTRKLETNLDHARKKLLSLQPPQDVSDDQLKQAFDDLCHNIEDWVDIECEELGSLEELFSATNGWNNTEMRIAEYHITEDDIKLSGEFPNIRSNIVMNAIFSLIYECCFREERWGGWVDTNEEKFLNGLVEAMSMRKSVSSASLALEFQSGLKYTNNAQLRRWRSETFQALQNSAHRAYIREKHQRVSQGVLHSMLKHFADKRNRIAGQKLRSKIIEPAYALADMIKASTSGYKFDFMVNSSSPNTYLAAKDVSAYSLVDACTGIEEENTVDLKHEGSLGRLRLCVFPALQKVQDSGERSCLSKALVVLEKQPEMDEKATVAVTETAKNANEGEGAVDDPISPESVGTLEFTKPESSNGVLPEIVETNTTQRSTTPDGQPAKHPYSWTDTPKKIQAEIVW